MIQPPPRRCAANGCPYVGPWTEATAHRCPSHYQQQEDR